MNRPLVVCILLFLMKTSVPGQTAAAKYAIFDGRGNPATFDQLLRSAAESDVVFLGELHDDAVGHAFQLEFFEAAVRNIGPQRKLVLSLEMFERDVQIVLDEYLSGAITEDHFLRSSRPWTNYRTDYRPVVELAKSNRIPVIAANAPRRYVNMVSRGGRQALGRLSKEARSWIAPLPYAEPSKAYADKFRALMGPSPEARMGLENILSSQSLWDATMAYWISRSLKENKGSLVIHLNGGFHTESRLGTVEHLAKYRPKARSLVVTIRYENEFRAFDPAKHKDLGDFVVLTDVREPRSRR